MAGFTTKLYPGWWVHVGLFVCAAVAVGSSSYTFGLFVVPVNDELGISRADINNGYVALLVGVALLSPLVGRLLDRVSARWVICSGGLAYAGGLTVLSYTESGWLMLAVMLLPVAYGFAACGTLAMNTVVVRWFKRRRGRAVGIIAISTSSGGFLFAPFTAMMITDFDWRTALLINAAIVVVVVSLATVLLIRDRPRGTETGYQAEFETDDATPRDSNPKESDGPQETWSYRQLAGSRNFWLLAIAIGLLLGSDQAMITSKLPFFLDIGITMQQGAFILSCTTVSAICGKLLIGYLADKVDLRLVYHGVAIAHIALLVVYLSEPSYWTVLLASSFLGVAIGGVFPVWSTLLAWLFGTRNYGMVMGVMTLIVKGISIVAIRFVGEVYDATGSYLPAFTIFAGGVGLAMVLVAMLKPVGVSDVSAAPVQVER